MNLSKTFITMQEFPSELLQSKYDVELLLFLCYSNTSF